MMRFKRTGSFLLALCLAAAMLPAEALAAEAADGQEAITQPWDDSEVSEDTQISDPGTENLGLDESVSAEETNGGEHSSSKNVDILPPSNAYTAEEENVEELDSPGSVDNAVLSLASTETFTPYDGASYALTYSENDDGTLTITGYTGTAEGGLVLPESIEGKTVTRIGNYAFEGSSGFTGSLVIPDSVTWIGGYAFSGCSGFTGSLTIPDSVAEIEWHAFSDCSGFTGSLTIPDGVTAIGWGTFSGCSGFTGSLTIPDSVTTIEYAAFSGCSGFTGTLVIGNNVEQIGDYAFADCAGFSGELYFPDSLVEVGYEAFSDCSGFTGSLVIPDSVTVLGPLAFDGCSGFSGDLVLGNGIKEISRRAFFNCSGFTGSLIIGDAVTTIGGGAFYNCTGFTGKLTIPSSVQNIESSTRYGSSTIDYGAFENCTGLTGNLIIPDNVVTIGAKTFYNCSGFDGTLKLGGSVETIGACAFSGCTGLKGNLVIPDNVKTISSYLYYLYEGKYFRYEASSSFGAFRNCTGFTGNLVIGTGLESIGPGAFENCSGFTGSLIIPDSVTEIGSEAFSGCGGFTGSLTIGNSVTTIEYGAFNGCSGFTGNLIIPGSVTEIGSSAFSGCSGFIGSLTIGNSVTRIGGSAFSGCSGLTGSLTIPDSVTEIGSDAFYGCSSLTGSLMIGNGITQIDQDMFHGCNGFTGDLTIGSSVTEIGDDAFSSCNGFTGSLTIPNSVTKIGDSAFSGCNCFTGSLIIPDSVTEIGDSAFYGCSGFNGSLIIPDSVTEIGFSLFSGCSGFTGNLVIPDSVTEIGSSSFFGCSGFTGNLVIPDGVTEIGSFAFFGCSGFTGNLVISDSVTTIESSAFYGCSGLTGNLVIPDSVTTIGYSAFSGCSGFNGSLSIPKEVTSIDYDAFEDTNFQNIYYSGTEAQWNALGVQGLPESCVIHCAGGTSGEIPDSPGGDTSEIKPDIGEDGVGLVTAQTADSIAIDGVTYSYGSSLNVHDEDYLGKYVSYYLNLAGTEIINIVDLTRVQGIYTGPGAYGNEIIIGGKTYSYEGDPSSLDSYLNQEVAVYYYYYERSYACYVAPCSVEVGTLTNLDILSTPATAYLNGTAYPIYSSRADWLVKKLRPLLNGGQVVLELEDGKVVGVRTLASYYETPFFQVSLDKEAVDWRNGSFETNQIGVDISLRSIADLPQKIRAALRADPTRTITVEEITFSSSEGGPYITFGQGETSSTTTYADGKGNLRPGDSFSLSAFAYLGDKWAWGNTLSVPVKFTATVRYRINGVSETATVSSAVRLSNQDEIERLAQLEQQQKEEVAPKLEEEVRDASGEAKSLMPRDTAVINLGYTLQTNLGVDDKQVKLLAQDVLTRILFYTTPKKAWQEELRDKIESKVFTKVFGNYKPPVSTDSSTLRLNYVMATGEYGNQYIQLVCQLNNFSLNGSEFARYATIKYEVLGPAGNEKKEVPQRLRSGALGQMTATNIDAFAKAAYSVVESELKRAYNLAYGNDFNLAADDLLNDCVKQILKGKKKTASDVVWEFITAPAKNYKVKCPVDVYVYDESDSLCASIVDDQVELPSDEFEMEIVGDAKYLRGVPYNYRLEYVATAPGSMNVEITERINKDSSLRTVALENVPLYAGAQYDQLSPSNLIGQASEYRIESGTCLVQTVDRMYDALTLGLPSIQLLGLTAQRNSTGCTAVLQVRNSGAGDGTAQYYVVAYDANWRMVALVTDEFELTAGAAKNRSYTLNADAPVAHVKAFALEGNDFSPLCASVVCDI